jgi:hypothetical protein
MKEINKSEVVSALGEMAAELTATKSNVEKFAEDLSAMKPEDMDFTFDEAPGGEAEGKGVEEGEGKPEGIEDSSKEEEKEKLPKTKEEAKKILDEATKDIQAVVDGLDGILGQAEQEKEAAVIKRPNAKYASNLSELSKNADAAIRDAKGALKHWAFLKKAYRPQESVANLTHPDLKQVANTLEQMSIFEKAMNKLGFVRASKQTMATAVPPTGAEFSGDLWPNGKDPKEIETRHWQAGASEFDRSKAKEDKNPNAAVDPRLTDEGNPHDEKPYVNASLYIPDDNKFGAYWEVTDSKTGRSLVATFANIPEKVGPKNESTYKYFTSEKYGSQIATRVIQSGIEEVATVLGANFVKTADLQSAAREPKIKDKGKVRKYYAEAFGDRAYARELTSTTKQAGEKGAVNSEMNVEYKPKDDKVESTNTGEDFGKAKDGPGKLSSQEPSAEDKALIRARAERAVELAKVCASRGGVAFVKKAMLDKASEYMQMDDTTFSATANALNSLPIVNESALKEAHIPDTEIGIVGNKSEGVRTPMAKVKTEDINPSVKSDANISKNASLVPQITSDSEQKRDISGLFSTTLKRLQKAGVSVNKLRQPTYSSRSGK